MVRILANAHIGFGTGISGFTFMQTIWVQIKKDYKETQSEMVMEEVWQKF